MVQDAHAVSMTIIVIAFIFLIGPLAVLYGADSRLDEPRR